MHAITHKEYTAFKEFVSKNPHYNLMGLDVGTKKIGIAMYSTTTNVTLPLTVIRYSSLNVCMLQIQGMARERNISAFVVGYPVTMRSAASTSVAMVEVFIKEFKKYAEDRMIMLYDERMSTALANRLLHQYDVNNRGECRVSNNQKQLKRKMKVNDAVAAGIILEGFVSNMRFTLN